MKDKTIFKLQANICKSLGHPVRIEMIDLLRDKKMSFGELGRATGCLKSNLSQHLSSMAAKGILLRRKEGTNVYYELTSKKVAVACRTMREVLIENVEKQKQILMRTA